MVDRAGLSKSIASSEASDSTASAGGVSLAALRTMHQAFMQAVDAAAVPLAGVDFTSAPRRAKPITVALGTLDLSGRDARLTLTALLALPDFEQFEHWLGEPGARLTGFDLPFGLPREFVLSQGWPTDWQACIAHYASLSREHLRERFRHFCAGRPVGGKFAHRQTDGPAGASPSMKWVNPPVAWMLHAGVPRLIAADLSLPGLRIGSPVRLGVEAYPGLLARQVSSASYKSDTRARQTAARHSVRQALLGALLDGAIGPVGGLVCADLHQQQMLDDGTGDSLDAVLCLAQAAVAVARPQADFGLPAGLDPLEGWITGAGV